MLPRKYPSGSAKRKKKETKKKITQSMKGSMDKFVLKETNVVQEILIDNFNDQNAQENRSEEQIEAGYVANTMGIDEDKRNNEESERIEFIDHSLNIFDPRVWESLDTKMKDLLVEKGPIKEVNFEYPRDELGRNFSSEYYNIVLPNKTSHEKKWLVYSKELDKVFCFCCKLFKTLQSRSQLAEEGSRDWKHLSEKLREHEKSREHLANLRSMVELQVRLRKNETIVKELQEQIKNETHRWRRVLTRIVAVVKCLAKNIFSFRGKNENLEDNSKGNFLGLIEMIGEFDPIMQEHRRLIKGKEIHHHYLSHKIQNELITNISLKVKNVVIEKIKKAKYYSVILDCTTDASHKEQMTLILRCVDVSCIPVKIEEYFIEFLNVENTSGLSLFNELCAALDSFGLYIDNIRGQGYDNGSNMRGRHQGVQKRLLDINPIAFYMPCVFSNSTKRWSILLDCLDNLTLKSLCTKRWESHIESVKAIKSQVGQIREALLKVADLTDDARLSRDARLLATRELSSFEFFSRLVIWYDILYNINSVCKSLQSETMHIDVAVKQLKGLVSFFENYREEGFASAINSAKKIASNIGVDPVFPERRQTSRKRQFVEIANTEREPQIAEERFRTDYFLVVVDISLLELRSRFEQLNSFEAMFGFLMDGGQLMALDEDYLRKYCVNLESALKKNDVFDIDANDLLLELQMLQSMLPLEAYDTNKSWTSIKILEFALKMEVFPLVVVAYQILLTIHVTVASAERSFFKLKLLKSYLRTTMSQERLNGLATLCIEKDILEDISYDDIIDDFASKNARRVRFK
ncbi:uncharacterized protein [Henckelia pumila]|uniref:uncharacterized protein n=1 Tax=Henckelia pumila TaxID=405737 RepID=UPI003C6E1DB9